MTARSPWRLVVLTIALYSAFVVVKLAYLDFDVSKFIVAGDYFCSANSLSQPIAIEKQSHGYDGQFYYRLALDPATRRRTEFGITIDNPVIRAQRIVYPMAARALALGRAAWIPITLVLVNLLAVTGIAWIAAILAARASIPASVALLIPFYPGFLLTLSRDTTEILAALFGLAALLAADRRRFWLAAALASVAVLTKEATLLYLSGFAVVELIRTIRSRRPSVGLLACTIPVLVYGGWQAILKARWGDLPATALGSSDLSLVPLAGYATSLRALVADVIASPLRYSVLYGLVTYLMMAAFVLFVGGRLAAARRGALAYTVPWLLYVLLAVAFTDAVWGEPYGYLRVLDGLYLFGILALLAVRDERSLRALMPIVGVTWLATAFFTL